ncbi:MAG: xseB [Crocinitomicaceae bacterium]|jgi:exodeoxyribonuclease VII small subunit|nr:xseB [Crocinitomicaceae bacterium]
MAKEKAKQPEGEELNYQAAFEELQQLVQDIENGEISVDELSVKVKRAAELIQLCKRKLTSTEEDVNEILRELGED